MASPTPILSPDEAERIAEVIANAADQFLIAYIIQARFEECGPYSVAFTMAHCLELSIKAAYWLEKRTPPDGHEIEPLIKALRPGLGDELENLLPDPVVRQKFRDRVDAMNIAAPMDMLEWFFDVNPNFDDDEWMVLYALFRPVNLKYGVTKKNPTIIRMMLPERLRLNRKGLRLTGCARERFPNKEQHRDKLRKFVARLPKRRTIIDAINELLEKGSAYFNPKDEDAVPFPRLIFDAAELELLRDTLALK
jgi:hypothetical protein